eukprot:3499781-Lingulodinium_polyedra.AAC.1
MLRQCCLDAVARCVECRLGGHVVVVRWLRCCYLVVARSLPTMLQTCWQNAGDMLLERCQNAAAM